MSCPGLSEQNDNFEKNISNNLVYGKSMKEMIRVAKCVRKRLKKRLNILDEKDTEIK